jgi:hypothetical protein
MPNWTQWKALASRHRVAIIVILVSGVAIGFVALSPDFQQCVDANQGTNPAQGPYYIVAHFLGIVWWCGGVFSKENGDTITAFATVIMAIFTGTLWSITDKSVRLARDEFVATHRPRVVLQRITAAQRGGASGILPVPATIDLVFVNAGETTAKIVDWYAVHYFRNFTDAFRPMYWPIWHSEIEFTLAPGESRTVTATHRSLDMFTRSFVNGLAAMVVIGDITYIGDDGIKRTTGFCRPWSVSEGNWQPGTDPQYEYAY